MVLPRRTIVQRAKAYDLNSGLDPPSAACIFRVGEVGSSWVVRSENGTALSASASHESGSQFGTGMGQTRGLAEFINRNRQMRL